MKRDQGFPQHSRTPAGQAPRWDKRDLYALLTLVVLWGLFFWRYFAPDPADLVALPPGDFSDHFYVLRSWAYDQFLAGRFPLWGGEGIWSVYPFQADPESALFYPPAALSLLFWLARGWTYFPLNGFLMEAVAHILLASVLTYLFLRHVVRHRSAALLGSLAFAYGGYLVSYPLQQISFLEAAVWLPLALLQVRRLSETGRRRHLVLAAVTFTLAFLPGNPQNLTFLIYTTLAYYAFLCWRERAPWRRFAGHVILIGLLTVALSAVQLLPSVEWWRLSIRASIPFETAATGFPPHDVVQLVFTGMVSWWQPLYVGLLSLALALVAGACSRKRDVPFWAGLALVALVFSLGKHVFGFEVAYFALPGVGLFRNQERHAYLFTFALAVLAAYGADRLLFPLARRDGRFVAQLARWQRNAFTIILALLVAIILLRQIQIGTGGGQVTDYLAVLLLCLGLATLLFYLRLYRRRSRRIWGTMLLIVLVFDLFSVNRSRFYAPVHNPHARSPLWQQVLDDSAFFRVQEGDVFPLKGNVPGRRQLRQVWGVAIPLAHYQEFLQRVPEEVRWRLLGVKYVVTERSSLVLADNVEAERLAQEGEGDTLQTLYRLPEAPRAAWVVHQATVAGDREELYEALNRPDFDPFASVVVWEPVPIEEGDPTQDWVHLTSFAPDRITLDAHLERAGLLVLGEVTYPGWRVYVDGQRTPLYEANGVLRAVVVPPGAVQVEFRFCPVPFYAGLAVSASTLLGLVGWALARWLSVRRSGRRRPKNPKRTMEEPNEP
jgi:hypothetical protein